MRILILALILVMQSALGVALAQSLVRDAEIEASLREWSDPIFVASGLRAEDVEIHIVNDRSLNAFVTGGQNIFLNTGFIMATDNVGQVLAVVSHETCHIACGHSVTRSLAARSALGPAIISIGLGILAAVAGAPDAGIAIAASAQNFGMRSLFVYTRAEEAMADQKGIEYLAAAGYSPAGLVEFFEKFRSQEVLSEARQDPYFRSHPLPSDRIRFARVTAQRTGLLEVEPSPRIQHQYAMMKAKLIGYFEPMARVLRHYPADDTSMPARYARAHASFKVSDVSTALKETNALLAVEPNNPYFNELLGFILFENGRATEAIGPHRVAVANAPDKALLLVNLARSLAARGTDADLQEAKSVLNQALAVERDNSFAWRELSVVYERLGERALAEHATAESRYHVGDYEQARRFARRALEDLEQGSIAYVQASDIEVTARAYLERGRR